MAKMPEPAELERMGYWPISRAAKVLDIGEERIRQLVKEGYIERSPYRGFVLGVSAVQGYIRSLRDTIQNQQAKGSQNRARDARADLLAIQIAEKRGELIKLEEAAGILSVCLGMLQSELMGLPAGVTRDRELRHRIQDRIDGSFKRAVERIERFRQTGDLEAA